MDEIPVGDRGPLPSLIVGQRKNQTLSVFSPLFGERKGSKLLEVLHLIKLQEHMIKLLGDSETSDSIHVTRDETTTCWNKENIRAFSESAADNNGSQIKEKKRGEGK